MRRRLTASKDLEYLWHFKALARKKCSRVAQLLGLNSRICYAPPGAPPSNFSKKYEVGYAQQAKAEGSVRF